MKHSLVNMTSSELHINNFCPCCEHQWMDKVKKNGECPNCGVKYEMTELSNGSIEIAYYIPLDKLPTYNL